MRALIAAGERSAPVLTLAKLANVGLSMLWGFAVTFVFVRALPGAEFQAFLLLIAFNNFTQSAEFGLTNVIYARLRRFWLARMRGSGATEEDGDFRREEIGVLFLFLGALVVGGGVLVAMAIMLGWIRTDLPAIFLIFFLASALNVLLLLARRALAAVDRNLLWEMLDCLRRVAGLAILLAVLAGFDLMASVAVQLLLNCAAVLAGMALIQQRVGMRLRQWFAWRVGGGHVRRRYMRDIGASAALTLSEVAAYNAPYFLIAGLARDPALILMFDFAFKMIRAVTTAIRATIEGALPRLTRCWFAGDGQAFRRGLRRALGVALGVAVCANILLIAIGQRLYAILFDGRDILSMGELGLLCLLLLTVAVICASVYVQGALGRFGPLLRQSLPFLAGSLLSVPLALWWAGQAGAAAGPRFMMLYALLFAGVALLHGVALRRLARVL
ncbi:MAG: hypothetical protein AB7E05_01465 [Sphingobium sp.]